MYCRVCNFNKEIAVTVSQLCGYVHAPCNDCRIRGKSHSSPVSRAVIGVCGERRERREVTGGGEEEERWGWGDSW